MYTSIRVNCHLFLSRLKLESAGQILVKIPYTKFQEIHSSESLVVHVDRRTDGQNEHDETNCRFSQILYKDVYKGREKTG